MVPQNAHSIKDYKIQRNSNVVLNMGLCGGALDSRVEKGTTTSFKDIVKRKSSTCVPKIQNTPNTYIVEKMEKAPSMDVNLP